MVDGTRVFLVSLVAVTTAVYPRYDIAHETLYGDTLWGEIEGLQNPNDCRRSRLLIASLKDNEGLGSLLISVAGALAEAYHSRRALILSPNRILYAGWPTYTERSSRCRDPSLVGFSFECIFRPLGPCAYHDVSRKERLHLVSGYANHDGARVKIADMRRAGVALFSPAPKFRDLFLSDSTAKMIWASTITRYVSRLLPTLQRHVEHVVSGVQSMLRNRNPAGLVVGIHVRRGDLEKKTEKGTARYPERKVFPTQAYLQEIPEETSGVFWATDSAEALPTEVHHLDPRCFYFKDKGANNTFRPKKEPSTPKHESPDLQGLGCSVGATSGVTGEGKIPHLALKRHRPKDGTHEAFKGADVISQHSLMIKAANSRRMTRATIEDLVILSSCDVIIGTIQSSFDVIASLLQYSRKLAAFSNQAVQHIWPSEHDSHGYEALESALYYPEDIPDLFTTSQIASRRIGIVGDEGRKDNTVWRDMEHIETSCEYYREFKAPKNTWIDAQWVSNGSVAHGGVHSGSLQGYSTVKDPSLRWKLVSARFQERPYLGNPITLSDPPPAQVATFDPETAMLSIDFDLFDDNVRYGHWAETTGVENGHGYVCPEEFLPRSERNIRHYVNMAEGLMMFWKDSRAVSCLHAVVQMITSSFPRFAERPKPIQEFYSHALRLLGDNDLEVILTNQWVMKDPYVQERLVERGVISR